MRENHFFWKKCKNLKILCYNFGKWSFGILKKSAQKGTKKSAQTPILLWLKFSLNYKNFSPLAKQTNLEIKVKFNAERGNLGKRVKSES